ncbi:MAG: hypothetical protein BAJALOKI2v1_600002 [Promethearchaeota archaeon]|nr:MAG: hypothetical protein BAJALOKI2v1_600002 [Candidatus Lokiarchaeota archaeon]
MGKDKKKEKEDEGSNLDNEWKLKVSKHLDNLIIVYEKIVNTFKDIDNYILKDAKTREEFETKVKNSIEDLPESTREVFTTFLEALP